MIIKSLLICSLLSSAVSVFAAEAASSSPAADGSSVIVEVNGVKLTLADFENKKPGTFFQARNTYYDTLRKAMDDYITEILLEQQAQKENVTVDQLLDRHVNSTVPTATPSEEALQLYYEGINSKEPFEKMRGPILDHIREARIAKAKAAYLETLRSQAKVVLHLAQPRTTISTKGAPVRGIPNAPVTIVEFADYECPYCQQVQPALDKLEAEYKGKIAFAFKDLPLPMHPHAQKAAEAAHCAGAQGKYWEYHDQLFQTKQLEIPQLKESAAAIKLDTKAFNECLEGGKQLEEIKASSAEAVALQLQGTPSFFINGRFFSGGLSYEDLRRVIDEEMKAASTPQQAAR
jgi:protein-disulfide isomerase